MGLLEYWSLYFHLDSFLEEDRFDIEELYFFGKIFLIIDFEFIGSLLVEIGLTRLWIDDDLWAFGFFFDDGTIFYISHCL